MTNGVVIYSLLRLHNLNISIVFVVMIMEEYSSHGETRDFRLEMIYSYNILTQAEKVSLETMVKSYAPHLMIKNIREFVKMVLEGLLLLGKTPGWVVVMIYMLNE